MENTKITSPFPSSAAAVKNIYNRASAVCALAGGAGNESQCSGTAAKSSPDNPSPSISTAPAPLDLFDHFKKGWSD